MPDTKPIQAEDEYPDDLLDEIAILDRWSDEAIKRAFIEYPEHILVVSRTYEEWVAAEFRGTLHDAATSYEMEEATERGRAVARRRLLRLLRKTLTPAHN